MPLSKKAHIIDLTEQFFRKSVWFHSFLCGWFWGAEQGNKGENTKALKAFKRYLE